jgi:hypothetical protein
MGVRFPRSSVSLLVAGAIGVPLALYLASRATDPRR